MSTRTTTSGFSLIEMLMYVALLTLILVALVNIVFAFSKSYEQLGALRTAEHTGLTGMERMARDIHWATSVDTGGSTLGSSPGVLSVLIGTSTTKFYVVNGELRVSVDAIDIGPLSVSSAKVTNLVFRLITTTESQAVKIEMTVQGIAGSAVRSKTYRSTIILKNS